MYTRRLAQMRGLVRAAARARWPDAGALCRQLLALTRARSARALHPSLYRLGSGTAGSWREVGKVIDLKGNEGGVDWVVYGARAACARRRRLRTRSRSRAAPPVRAAPPLAQAACTRTSR
jgi:hypothetical protein